MLNIFISYSHKDESFREELGTHLSPLKRQQLIDEWHDRKILPGQVIEQKISEHLENANIILLLISPDYINSYWCYDKEMTRALEKQEEGSAAVIPVILRACDWHGTPFGKLLALPVDGKPIKSFQDRDEAYTTVVKGIRQLIKQKQQGSEKLSASTQTRSAGSIPQTQQGPRSTNTKLPQDFSELDYDQFLEQSFLYVQKFFKNSLHDLKYQNQDIETQFKNVGDDMFTATVYSGGRRVRHYQVWFDPQSSHFGGLKYSESQNLLQGTRKEWNENFRVESNGENMYLKAIGLSMISYTSSYPKQMSQSQVANFMWDSFVQNLS